MRLLALLSLALLATAPASAQDYRPAPQQIEGTIGRGDATDAEGRRYDDVALELTRGQRVAISALPAPGSRLSLTLELRSADGGRVLATGIPEAAGGAPQVEYRADSDAVVIIRVLAGGSTSGAYRIDLLRVARPSRNYGSAIGGSIRPAPAPAPGDSASDGALPGPRSRFIICPGHPRCPR